MDGNEAPGTDGRDPVPAASGAAVEAGDRIDSLAVPAPGQIVVPPAYAGFMDGKEAPETGKEAPETDGTGPVPAAVSGAVAGPVGVVVGSLADAMTELNALVQVADVALEDDWSGEDLLERSKENRLQRLGVVRRLESELAAVKALTIAEYVGIEDALTPPDLGITHQRAREISLIAEVGGILGLGAGAAADLVSTS
ncbi:hypothetical protein ACRB8A_16460 [Arthrobacter sp. G.S.26]|uniref:hypothetical protein n=1 Tax=Arthrobacter sp. G.S.26 TaxID=3433706 RepID=UPI003D77419F